MTRLAKGFFLTALLLAGAARAATVPADSPLATLKSLDGGDLTLPSKQRLLVVFWATWCPSCEEELTKTLPAFDHRSDVGVVAINVDDDTSKVQHFIDKHHLKLSIARDPGQKLATALNVFAVPTWAVYARDEKGGHRLVDSAASWDDARVKTALR